jgi:hypothetical protein
LVTWAYWHFWRQVDVPKVHILLDTHAAAILMKEQVSWQPTSVFHMQSVSWLHLAIVDQRNWHFFTHPALPTTRHIMSWLQVAGLSLTSQRREQVLVNLLYSQTVLALQATADSDRTQALVHTPRPESKVQAASALQLASTVPYFWRQVGLHI